LAKRLGAGRAIGKRVAGQIPYPGKFRRLLRLDWTNSKQKDGLQEAEKNSFKHCFALPFLLLTAFC
jgi:hypothetical protein